MGLNAIVVSFYPSHFSDCLLLMCREIIEFCTLILNLSLLLSTLILVQIVLPLSLLNFLDRKISPANSDHLSNIYSSSICVLLH